MKYLEIFFILPGTKKDTVFLLARVWNFSPKRKYITNAFTFDLFFLVELENFEEAFENYLVRGFEVFSLVVIDFHQKIIQLGRFEVYLLRIILAKLAIIVVPTISLC